MVILATDRAASVVGLLGRDDWQVGWNQEVNTCACVWHKVGLILSVVDTESNFESHESGHGRDHLPAETVQAGVGRRERSADEGVRSSQDSSSSSHAKMQ